MSEISVGNLVVLKSSPDVLMTVQAVTEDSANCTWLDASKKQTDGIFKISSLRIHEEVPPAPIKRAIAVSSTNRRGGY